jgi:hypothetical protein
MTPSVISGGRFWRISRNAWDVGFYRSVDNRLQTRHVRRFRAFEEAVKQTADELLHVRFINPGDDLQVRERRRDLIRLEAERHRDRARMLAIRHGRECGAADGSRFPDHPRLLDRGRRQED